MTFKLSLRSVLTGGLTLLCAGSSACGDHCSDETYCRAIDVISWCADHAGCLIEGEESVDARPDSGRRFPASSISFFGVPTPHRFVFPLHEFRAELERYPLLVLSAKAGAPLRADTAVLLFDGQPASCERRFEGYGFGWECEVNGDIDTVEFRNDDSESPSYDIEVKLVEKRCSGREEICDL